MTRPQALLHQSRDGRELNHWLSNPAARVFLKFLAKNLELFLTGLRANHETLATRAIHRLDDQFIQAVKNFGQALRFFEAPGGHVLNQRLFV